MEMTKFSIFIFRRDFRIVDNVGLNLLDGAGIPIWPVFIFNPIQVDPDKNPFRSDNAMQFMVESLLDLRQRLRAVGSDLTVLYGPSEPTMEALTELKPESVYTNQDYTLYARVRSMKLGAVCEKRGIDYVVAEDYLLNPLSENLVTSTGKAYAQFSAYYQNALKRPVAKPSKHKLKHLMTPSQQKRLLARLPGKHIFSLEKAAKLYAENKDIAHHGGRTEGLAVLKSVGVRVRHYSTTRDEFDHRTSELSAYIKFGCFSIREVYYEIRAQVTNATDRDALLRQLYWRDFYYRIAWHSPTVLAAVASFDRNYNPAYCRMPWFSRIKSEYTEYAKPTALALAHLKAWCLGRTGVPIVDACMRQLNQTGYMPNRGRLIVSTFLIRNLHWSWEDGEVYFANRLYDYDPAQNNGGWQWSSGSGPDSQPYFRTLNPWRQGLEHDPSAEYIKRWVPELANVPAEHIHKWYEYCNYSEYASLRYPKPIVDVAKTFDASKKMYIKHIRTRLPWRPLNETGKTRFIVMVARQILD